MRTFAIRALGIAALYFMSPALSLGCKCAPHRPACEELWTTGTAFIGKVTQVSPSYESFEAFIRDKLTPHEIESLGEIDDEEILSEEMKRLIARILPLQLRTSLAKVKTGADLDNLMVEAFPFMYEQRRIAFEVSETFRGKPASVREIRTGYGWGDCGYPFELGRTYIVFASENDKNGEFVTGICAGTQELTENSGVAAYLRSVKMGRADTSVFGSVILHEVSGGVRAEPGTLPAVVKLQSGTMTWEAPLNADRSFSFTALSAGRYRLSVEAPGMRIRVVPAEFDLRPFACVRPQIIVMDPAKP